MRNIGAGDLKKLKASREHRGSNEGAPRESAGASQGHES